MFSDLEIKSARETTFLSWSPHQCCYSYNRSRSLKASCVVGETGNLDLAFSRGRFVCVEDGSLSGQERCCQLTSASLSAVLCDECLVDSVLVQHHVQISLCVSAHRGVTAVSETSKLVLKSFLVVIRCSGVVFVRKMNVLQLDAVQVLSPF